MAHNINSVLFVILRPVSGANEDEIKVFHDEVNKMKDLTFKNARDYIHNLTACSKGVAASPLKDIYILNAERRNHPESCHDKSTSCGSPFVILQRLSVHYQDARNIYR